jgi:predicted amidophosphoribosyltransferase
MHLIDHLFLRPCCICGSIGAPLCSTCCQGLTLSHADDAILDYHDPHVATVIQAWKREGMFRVLFLLRGLIEVAVNEIPTDIVTFVPARKAAWLERGFHPAQQVAKVVGKALRAPVISPPVTRIHHAERLTFQDKVARRGMAEQQYTPVGAPTEKLRGKRVIICDDVTTTGATLDVVASLVQAQWQGVSIQKITLARGG